MRATILAAGGLACAGAAMTIAAFAGGGSDPPAPAAVTAQAQAPQAGLNVWIAQGCGSCHTFAPANSTAPIGPDLAESLKGQPRDYVMESIVLPSAHAAAGYDAGTMPEDYAQRIRPQDLDPLVDFVISGVRK